MNAYTLAKERYAALGVDTEAVLETLKNVTVSVHCWQGDDVVGFDAKEALSGGIQTTGNYPGKATTPEQLMADFDEVLRLTPGKKKLNLHASYAIFEAGEFADRDAIQPKHFSRWVAYAKERGLGIDFNPTFFSHSMVKDGLTLSSPDETVRHFWVEHGKRCMAIAEYFAEETGKPCVINFWIPDGYKDYPADRLSPRRRYAQSMDEILSVPYDKTKVFPGIESKVFGIGLEAYTVGSAANSATQLVQNRMHATTDNTGGGARLYSENRMLNQTVTADRSYPIAIVHGYRGLNVSNYVPGDGTTMGMSKYTMLGFLGNVAGWYEWNGDTWTGKTNGIVMEFSTAGVGGSAAAVSFSTAAGKHSTNEAACSWTNASSYPVYWKVEYATSADGATWSDYTEAVNAATGERGFEMRSLPWCINNSSTRTSVFDTANRSGVYTQSDFGFGLVPYRFVLPAEVLGKAKVRVRISPSSDVIATWNPGIDGYALGQTHRNLRIARTYPFDIANGVYVEDLSIQYK